MSGQAGRSLDVGDPVSCAVVDAAGDAVDCTRARERGADVVIAGFDVRRRSFGLDLQPRVRAHAQRSVDDEERAGSGIAVVDRGVDNVIRGGASLGVRGRVGDDGSRDDHGFFGVDFDGSVDVVADRYDSVFTTRSLRRSAAEPEEGQLDPLRATFVDDATVRVGSVNVGVVVDTALVDVSANARAAVQLIDTPDDARQVRHESAVAPAVDVGAVVRVVDGVALRAAAGHITTPPSARAALSLVPNPDVGVGVVSGDALDVDDFAEAGVDVENAFVTVNATAWGSLRSDDTRWLGLDGSLALRPGVDGLDARVVVSGAVADNDDGPAAGVLQPQGGLVLRYAPSSLPAGFFVRVAGAVPQSRLSVDEQQDAQLCPERPADPTVVQTTPCSGARGFAVVDVGAWVSVGQLRVDAVGENLSDAQGTWRGAVLGTGGQSVRVRLAFLF